MKVDNVVCARDSGGAYRVMIVTPDEIIEAKDEADAIVVLTTNGVPHHLARAWLSFAAMLVIDYDLFARNFVR